MKARALAPGLLAPLWGLLGLPTLSEGLGAPLGRGETSLRASPGTAVVNSRAGKMASCERLFPNCRLK